ncbi:MAG: hypothetical protein QG626_302 [Patescibacteria group bacterium]|jgi:hypothetical protein|nr:hypothetical protein [Patescibacteria group bacterium]
MVRGVESFGSSAESRKAYLAGEAKKVADLGRSKGMSLEDMGETGENVGSRSSHIKETRQGKQTPTGEMQYNTGSSNDIQQTIERVKAKQAQEKAARLEAKNRAEKMLEQGQERVADTAFEIEGDEEEPMVLSAQMAEARRAALRSMIEAESENGIEESEKRKSA